MSGAWPCNRMVPSLQEKDAYALKTAQPWSNAEYDISEQKCQAATRQAQLDSLDSHGPGTLPEGKRKPSAQLPAA